jgi:hypothetical protein
MGISRIFSHFRTHSPQVTGILAGMGFLLIVFFFPETYYNRNFNTTVTETSSDTGKEGSTDEVVAVSPFPKKTYLQELKPWSSIKPTSSLLNMFFRPWPLIVYPAVLYSFITFATTIGFSICVTVTNPPIFQKPPYNMSPGINSLIKVPALIGILLGSLYSGFMIDRYAQWYARRHNGTFEPETRLVALVVPFFLVPVGLLMFSCL